MISKKIHFCWFGKREKSDLIIKCINNWKKTCVGYEIKEWNENNLNLNSNDYVKNAYKNNMFSHVSDYVKFYALYNEGGIYLDTDQMLNRNIDEFLMNKVFFTAEDEEYVSTSIIGAEKGNNLIKLILEYYENHNIILSNGRYDMTPAVNIVTDIIKNKYNSKVFDRINLLDKGIILYPKYYFNEFDINNKNHNFGVHFSSQSWLNSNEFNIEELVTYKNYYCVMNDMLNDMLNNNGKVLDEFIGDRTFAIYGMGGVGKQLLLSLKVNDKKPKYIIDQFRDNEPILGIDVVKNREVHKKVDLLIITPMCNYNDIYRKLDLKYFKEVVLVNEVYGSKVYIK